MLSGLFTKEEPALRSNDPPPSLRGERAKVGFDHWSSWRLDADSGLPDGQVQAPGGGRHGIECRPVSSGPW